MDVQQPCDFFIQKSCEKFLSCFREETFLSLHASVDHLVFGGGGVKGMAFVSCLYEICNQSDEKWLYFLSKIKKISATSAGTVMGLLCSLGTSYEKVKSLVYELDLSNLLPTDFLSQNKLPLLQQFAFGPGFGLLPSSFIENFYKKLIRAVGLVENITFLELFAKTRTVLEFWAVDVVDVDVQSFSVKTHPHLSVAKAMAASSSIPFIFTTTEICGKRYTDGGVMMNIPVSNMDPSNTLIFTLATKPEKFSTVLGFSQNILLSMSNSQLKNVVLKCPKLGLSLVNIDVSGISFFDIFVSGAEHQLKLWEMSNKSGQLATQNFIGIHLLLLLLLLRFRRKSYEWTPPLLSTAETNSS